jgi:myo-inositol catabolism protein IolS
MMEHVTLPGTEFTVSRMAMGGCPLGGYGWGHVDDGEAIAAVRQADELGINFFDTADIYGLGRSEELLSQALGDRRYEVVIASKFGVRRTADRRTVMDISPAYLRKALESSLRRLRLECLPLYYIHWPDGRTPVEEAIAELERCRSAGKIRAFGVSNFNAEQLRRAARVGVVSAIQVQYSLVDRAKADSLRATAGELGVPLITWGSLAQGLLTGKYDSDSAFNPEDRRSRYENFQGDKLAVNLAVVARLKTIARRLEKRPGQVALRWLLDTPQVGCVLFGAKRPSQVEENAGAIGWRLSTEDYRFLNECHLEEERPTVAA